MMYILQGVPYIVTIMRNLQEWEPLHMGDGSSYAHDHSASWHIQLQRGTYKWECCHLSGIRPIPVGGCDTGQGMWRHLRQAKGRGIRAEHCFFVPYIISTIKIWYKSITVLFQFGGKEILVGNFLL